MIFLKWKTSKKPLFVEDELFLPKIGVIEKEKPVQKK